MNQINDFEKKQFTMLLTMIPRWGIFVWAFVANSWLFSAFGKFAGPRDGLRWKISVRFASLNSHLADVCNAGLRLRGGFPTRSAAGTKHRSQVTGHCFTYTETTQNNDLWPVTCVLYLPLGRRIVSRVMVGDVGKRCQSNYRVCSWWNFEAMGAFEAEVWLK